MASTKLKATAEAMNLGSGVAPLMMCTNEISGQWKR
jgi:hypothetical protein